jgi:hypothetical protein
MLFLFLNKALKEFFNKELYYFLFSTHKYYGCFIKFKLFYEKNAELYCFYK